VWATTYNSTYDAKAGTGNCAGGYVVQNTTTSGVQCVQSTSGTSYDFQCSPGNYVYNLTSAGGYSCSAPSGSGDITSVTGDTYITNGSTSGDVYLVFNETKMNNTMDARDSDHIYTHLSNFTDNLDYTVKNVNRSAYWDDLDAPLSAWLATYNATYDAKISDNTSWTQTYANGLYANILWNYNQTTATYNQYNAVWATTYNSTYDGKIANLVEDTSPQLGGYLDTNGQNIGSTSDEIDNIYVGTSKRIYFGDGQEANIYYNGTNLVITG
jgi:hypothetical protein